jgi:hypothetical protein
MKRLYVTTYCFRDSLDDSDLPNVTARLPEAVAGAGIIAHYRRLDGEGGFIIHELAEDARQESDASGGHEHQSAGSFEGSQLPPGRRAGVSRPNGAPAYYLGRPADVYISVFRPRRKRNPRNHLADAIDGHRERTPSPGPFAGAGTETVCVTPISA